MAKINARGAHQVGPTFFTTREYKARPDSVSWDQDAIVHEGFRLRSDGTIQRRMIRSVNADGSVIEHRGSAYTNMPHISVDMTIPDPADALRRWLTRSRLYTITKER